MKKKPAVKKPKTIFTDKNNRFISKIFGKYLRSQLFAPALLLRHLRLNGRFMTENGTGVKIIQKNYNNYLYVTAFNSFFLNKILDKKYLSNSGLNRLFFKVSRLKMINASNINSDESRVELIRFLKSQNITLKQLRKKNENYFNLQNGALKNQNMDQVWPFGRKFEKIIEAIVKKSTAGKALGTLISNLKNNSTRVGDLMSLLEKNLAIQHQHSSEFKQWRTVKSEPWSAGALSLYYYRNLAFNKYDKKTFDFLPEPSFMRSSNTLISKNITMKDVSGTDSKDIQNQFLYSMFSPSIRSQRQVSYFPEGITRVYLKALGLSSLTTQNRINISTGIDSVSQNNFQNATYRLILMPLHTHHGGKTIAIRNRGMVHSSSTNFAKTHSESGFDGKSSTGANSVFSKTMVKTRFVQPMKPEIKDGTVGLQSKIFHNENYIQNIFQTDLTRQMDEIRNPENIYQRNLKKSAYFRPPVYKQYAIFHSKLNRITSPIQKLHKTNISFYEKTNRLNKNLAAHHTGKNIVNHLENPEKTFRFAPPAPESIFQVLPGEQAGAKKSSGTHQRFIRRLPATMVNRSVVFQKEEGPRNEEEIIIEEKREKSHIYKSEFFEKTEQIKREQEIIERQLPRIADYIYRDLEKRLEIEKERRGIY